MNEATSPSQLFPIGQLGFATHPIDRAAHLREDATKLSELENQTNARFYVIDRDSIVLKSEGNGLRAAMTLGEARALGAGPTTIFLGLREGAPVFGMRISAEAINDVANHGATADTVRSVAMDGRIPPSELNTVAIAKSLLHWHHRHGYCANCGSPTAVTQGGWKRECPSCKVEHFPRTDPVVIMLVTDGQRALLGRNKRFVTGNWSCLAGFVEVSETIEDAVRREVREEAGIECGEVNYYKAQPWPFPSSLMIGCTAQAITFDIKVDPTELEDARWFTRSELIAMLERQHPQGLVTPTPIAIARHLLAHWAFNL